MSRRPADQNDEKAQIVRDNIKRFRTELGLSQAGLAAASGLSVQTIQGLEQAKRLNPSVQTLRAIAEALGRTLDDFDKLEPPPPDPARLRIFSISVVPGFEDAIDEDLLTELREAVARANRLQQERWRQRKKR